MRYKSYAKHAGLEDFSHVTILYYLDKANYDREKHLQRRPQNRDDMPLVGIFSQRGKDGPVYDKKDAEVPEWVTRLMEHYF